MLEKIKADIEAAVPNCRVEIIPNGSPSGQHSLLVEPSRAVEIAIFLRDSADLRLDYCSNVSGVDWLDTETSEKVKVKTLVDGFHRQHERFAPPKTLMEIKQEQGEVPPLFRLCAEWVLG